MRGLARSVKTKFAQPEIDRHLDFLEAELGRSTWFAGEELTGADILLSFPLQIAAAHAGLDASRPRLAAFLQRVAARPAWQRGGGAGRSLPAVVLPAARPMQHAVESGGPLWYRVPTRAVRPGGPLTTGVSRAAGRNGADPGAVAGPRRYPGIMVPFEAGDMRARDDSRCFRESAGT